MIKFQHPQQNCHITVEHPGGYCCEFQVVKELLNAYSEKPCIHCDGFEEQLNEVECELHDAKEDAMYWEEKAFEYKHQMAEEGNKDGTSATM